MNAEEVRTKLVDVLREFLPRVAPGEPVEMARPLNELGLDSMSAINLMLALEGAFEISVPDALLTAETFHSAATLESTVRHLRGDAK
ncbi:MULTISPECIES: phosphopantetheine-binding protein [Corallococcus]|uniref:phosphopantetheine-binding protein n=1 Tax=Corallococcus TaxID=83461 RepID=UPI00117CBF8A|nr:MULTISPECIES: phosphopantetheine-binding protein [Corallococcus]NBD08316.1 acyl carrier protein [Corallococcus silvisoli]TSC34274.1 acyl carrier protein [Corallococcus sp. Z5C101001]